MSDKDEHKPGHDPVHGEADAIGPATPKHPYDETALHEEELTAHGAVLAAEEKGPFADRVMGERKPGSPYR